MKLFILRYGKGGDVVKNSNGDILYFSDKVEAKKQRDELGGNTVVSYGPDHKLYNGGNK